MIYGLNGSRLKVQSIQPLIAARNIGPIELKTDWELFGLVGLKQEGWKAWKSKSSTFS